mmetsp:Transcript_102918/g.266045  ORF Transcript_102918/g.266045 Transcript_102918/m.266045 type:complete len:679 (-) Transcript_102918:296-2332(-)
MGSSEARHAAGKRPAYGKNGAANRGHKKGQGALRAGSAIKNSSASSKAGRTDPTGATRVKDPASRMRSESTIKRLQMYNKKPGKAADRRKQALKPHRIQPDRRWFGNTRVIAQNKIQTFRETMAKTQEDPFSVVLKRSKLPMSLLKETEGKATRMDLLSISPYQEVFGKGRRQKKPKLGNYDLEALLERADSRAEEYGNKVDAKSQVDASGAMRDFDNLEHAKHRKEEIFDKGTSRRIWGELYKVVDSADVIVQVLDARDPMGTRCRQLEQELRKNRAHKHIILLLNKVDLVPTWVSRRWIQVLMKEYPTLAFHASISNPFGKNALLNLCRQFGTLLKEKKHVTVAMIGYPNVGKSSVINTLKRKKVCKAAPVPGETRVWQYIALTKKLYLLDCPGIVPPTANDFANDSAKVLKGVVRAERIQTPSDYIDEVLSRVKKPYLLQRYKLPEDTEWKDAEEFLTILGEKMGKLAKGGEAQLDTVARIVLYDWQRGRIPYFTPPPEETSSSSSSRKAPAAAASSGDAPEALEDGPAADDKAAVDASAASSSGAGGAEEATAEDVGQQVLALAMKQPLSGLGCSMPFDEEDMRGEIVVAREGAEEADDAGEDASAKRGAAKRARQREVNSTAEDTAEGAESKGSKKRRRGNAKLTGAAGSDGRTGPRIQEGSVDWKAVVAEFG